MKLPDALGRAVRALGRLPALGRRSAERVAFALVRKPALRDELLQALQELAASVGCCSRCGSITARAEDPCAICQDASRDAALLCVVEEPGDVVLMERAGNYRGRYHVLMGKISPLRGQGPDELRIQALLDRIASGEVREVLLALDADVESDATASYLREVLAGRNVRVSRLAPGIPAGSGITYADPITLARAIQGRHEW